MEVTFKITPEEWAKISLAMPEIAKAFAEVTPVVLKSIPPETQKIMAEAFARAALDHNPFVQQAARLWMPWLVSAKN